MPRLKLPDYECPRCGYNSSLKSNMRRHLEFIQKQCVPLIVPEVNLTKEIIEDVLQKRKYITIESTNISLKNKLIIKPTTTPQTILQIINNHNTIYNYIVNINPVAKLNELLAYRQKDSIDFDSIVEEAYEKTVKKLKIGNNRAGGHMHLDEDHIIEMIHNVTKSQREDLEDMCVLQEDDRINFSTGDGDWQDYSFERGVKKIIQGLVDYCLRMYEKYLIRKIELATSMNKIVFTKSLEEYYYFIAVFDISPAVQEIGVNDTMILYNDDDEKYDENINGSDLEKYRIIERYSQMYTRVCDGQTKGQAKDLYKKVLVEIKVTTKKNLKELNKCVMDIINVDENFKTRILSMYNERG
jgi:hypothetical protein